jgi:hemerythrin
LADHFRHEEEYLQLLGYPARDAHGKHHAETLTALDRIAEEIRDGVIEPGEIAGECFNELLGTVLTMDMRFLNWHAEQKSRAS